MEHWRAVCTELHRVTGPGGPRLPAHGELGEMGGMGSDGGTRGRGGSCSGQRPASARVQQPAGQITKRSSNKEMLLSFCSDTTMEKSESFKMALYYNQ